MYIFTYIYIYYVARQRYSMIFIVHVRNMFESFNRHFQRHTKCFFVAGVVHYRHGLGDLILLELRHCRLICATRHDHQDDN